MQAFLERFFKLQEYNTNIKTEIVAGLTTFLTMAYISVVNPAILSSVGIPIKQVFMATSIAVIVGTLFMALVAKYPIAVAPGMGMNAYFASIIVSRGFSYRDVFGAVFLAGVLFFLISLTKLRGTIISSIPDSIKFSITSGIGLFIAFIGLKMSGIVVAGHGSTLVKLGDLNNPTTALTVVGLFITVTLMLRKVPGALFIGMSATTIIGYFAGLIKFSGLISAPPVPVFFDLSITGVFVNNLYAIVFSFLLITIFDTTGTMIGIGEQAGLFVDGKLPRAKSVFMADAIATTVGSLVGTSPSTAYVESSAGVAAGGRTGLTSLIVVILFTISMFFSPVITAISGLPAITAPVLIIVGCLMAQGLSKIKWSDFEEAFPAFMVIISMPLTSSIATGLAVGFITYPFIKLIMGKRKEVHPVLYVFGVIFALQMVFFPAN